jgi:hypothetical protein
MRHDVVLLRVSQGAHVLALEPVLALASAMGRGDGICITAYRYVIDAWNTDPCVGQHAAAIAGSVSHLLRELRKKDDTQL